MNKIKASIYIGLGLILFSCNNKSKEEKVASSENVAPSLQKYAMQTKGALGKNLVNAITNLGTAEAITFCNTKAMVITDSVGNQVNASIKRVSDKPRNPINIANEAEMSFIMELKDKKSKSEKIEPKITETEQEITASFPIETNAMCLQCHGGTATDIQPEVLKKITLLYPNDKATGYKENEIRGLFVVTQKK